MGTRINSKAFKRALDERGINASELAREMGECKQSVYKLRSGGPCSPKIARKYAAALGVPVRELIEIDFDEGDDHP